MSTMISLRQRAVVRALLLSAGIALVAACSNAGPTGPGGQVQPSGRTHADGGGINPHG